MFPLTFDLILLTCFEKSPVSFEGFFSGKIKRKNVFALWLSWIACSYSTNGKKKLSFPLHIIFIWELTEYKNVLYFIRFNFKMFFFSLHHLFRAEKCEVTLLLAFHCIRYLITFWRFCFVCFFLCVSCFFWVLACTYVCRYLNRSNCAMHCAYAAKSHLHYICAI